MDQNSKTLIPLDVGQIKKSAAKTNDSLKISDKPEINKEEVTGFSSNSMENESGVFKAAGSSFLSNSVSNGIFESLGMQGITQIGEF